MSSGSNQKIGAEASGVIPRILAFHKVAEGFSFGATNFSPRRFKRLLGFLLAQGYRFSDVAGGELTESDRACALTFDDGYAHLVQVLPECIEAYGIRPLIFVPTGLIGRSNSWDYSHVFVKSPHMTASDIRTLAGAGCEFGSHGVHHISLTGLSPRRLRLELTDSKQRLQDILGITVETISYPFGRTNPEVLEAAAEAGYKRGFTMDFPTPTDSPLTTGRLPVYGYDTALSLRRKLQPGRGYALEKLKARITNGLAGGTILWQRVFRRRHDSN